MPWTYDEDVQLKIRIHRKSKEMLGNIWQRSRFALQTAEVVAKKIPEYRRIKWGMVFRIYLRRWREGKWLARKLESSLGKRWWRKFI